jgi:ABC-2 type transport system permease protein
VRTIFRYTLARFRGTIIGWGIGLFLIGLMVMPMWDVLLKQRAQLESVLATLPGFMKAAMPGLDQMFTPAGFLGVRFFSSMPLILGIYAVLGGSGLLASDEESGVLDLVLAHPVSRSELFLGRLAGFTAATLIILAVGWVALVVPKQWSSLEVGGGALVLPFLSLLAVLLLFGTLALLLSMVLPSRRLSAMAAGLVVVGSYFLSTFARLNPALEALARFSPLDYYQGGDAIQGLNGEWFGGLLAVAGLFAALAWWCFERRDIRVVGEGSWRWPRWRRGRSDDRMLRRT